MSVAAPEHLTPAEKAQATRDRKRAERAALEARGALLASVVDQPQYAVHRNEPALALLGGDPGSALAACSQCGEAYVRRGAWDEADWRVREAMLAAGHRRDAGNGWCRDCHDQVDAEVAAYLAGLVDFYLADPSLLTRAPKAFRTAHPELFTGAEQDGTKEPETGQDDPDEDAPDSWGLDDFYFPPPMGDWVEEAVCAQTDPELFQTSPGSNENHAALDLCGQCPVRLHCLRYAVENPKAAVVGVWGGHNQFGLTKIRRTARAAARERLVADLADRTDAVVAAEPTPAAVPMDLLTAA